jgi:hypothetical protein
MKRLHVRWELFHKPITWVSFALAVLAFWLVWPVLSLQSFPHIPPRAWLGAFVMACADALLHAGSK